MRHNCTPLLTVLLILSFYVTEDLNATPFILHVKISGEKSDTVVFYGEKIFENESTFIMNITDEDMALFQRYFAIAEVVEYTNLILVGRGPGYYSLSLGKQHLTQTLNEYFLELSPSTLKRTDTSPFTQYEGATQLLVTVKADRNLRTFAANMDTDILSVNVPEGFMTVLVSSATLQELYVAGFHVNVIANLGVQPLIIPSEYHTYPEVVTELSQTQQNHPTLARTFPLGLSYEERNIPAIKISDNVGTDEPEPEVFICALHHARECATVEVCMYIINYLTDHYGEAGYENVTYLVDNREIYIVPMVNPDGKVYDDSGGGPGSGRMWRKNRQPCSGGIGTDLNRNYFYQWGGSGSSGTCTSEIFRGYQPFDAPETAAVQNFIMTHPDITVVLSYHSYGSLVLYPWGYTYDLIADAEDRHAHEIIAQKYASYTGYLASQASGLYLTSGDTGDWAYGVTKDDSMPVFTWTVELAGNTFYPPPSALPSMCETNCQASLYLLWCADNPYKILQSDTFSGIPVFFDTNSLFVVGNGAYCTDVLGTGKIAYGLAAGGVTENPEGRTHTILTSEEHNTGNLLVVGGPAVNFVAREFDGVFGISYVYNEGVSFQISCEGESIHLDIPQYPHEDICIVYVGEDNSRNVMLVWGYGWQGTYAGSVFIGDPVNWQAYATAHVLMLRWVDANADGLVQMWEVTVESSV